MLLQQERPPAIDADAFEDAVAVEEAVVEHGDPGLLGRRPLAIDVRDHNLTSRATRQNLVTIRCKVSSCPPSRRLPVAATLDAVGDRWTLLIVRDLLRGITRYGDLARSLEPIAPNLLAGRLRRLEDLGLVTRERYSERPLRASYALTERGRALAPVIVTLGRFGIDHLGTRRARLPRGPHRLRRPGASDRLALPALR